jgi:hypothetical protein
VDGYPRIHWEAEGVIPYCTCLADARDAAEDKLGLVASTSSIPFPAPTLLDQPVLCFPFGVGFSTTHLIR